MPAHKHLTIGELSKITGVHIKSLRYYDRIGALRPAQTDPQTGYRYYAYPQIAMVDAIRICIELGIPLKDFQGYRTADGGKIHYAKLLERGKEMAEKKIRSIRAGMRFIHELEAEIKRNETEVTERFKAFGFPRKRYLVAPSGHRWGDEEYDLALAGLCLRAAENGYGSGYEIGLLHIHRPDAVERFQFVEIQRPPRRKTPEIKTLPAGRYLARRVSESRIEAAPEEFAALFSRDYDKVVIETELFTGEYNIERPTFELRCSLPEDAPPSAPGR